MITINIGSRKRWTCGALLITIAALFGCILYYSVADNVHDTTRIEEGSVFQMYLPPLPNQAERQSEQYHRQLLASSPSANRSSSCQLVDHVTKKPRDFRVLIFIERSFVDLFLNWLRFYRIACPDENAAMFHLEVVCLGDFSNVDIILQYYGITCSNKSLSTLDVSLSASGNQDNKLYNIWMYRLEIVKQYMAENIDVILSDSDALWIGNPFPDLQKSMAISNIVASRGFYPWDLSIKWGACLCMGFIYIKASAFGYEFISTINADMTLKSFNATLHNVTFQADDQVAINGQLDKWNVSWPVDMIVGGDEHETGFVVRNNIKYGITLLAHDAYLRYCLPPGTQWLTNTAKHQKSIQEKMKLVTVVHCNVATGSNNNKKNFMRLHNMWSHNYSDMSKLVPELRVKALSNIYLQSLRKEDEENASNFTRDLKNYGSILRKKLKEKLEARKAERSVKYAEQRAALTQQRVGFGRNISLSLQDRLTMHNKTAQNPHYTTTVPRSRLVRGTVFPAVTDAGHEGNSKGNNVFSNDYPRMESFGLPASLNHKNQFWKWVNETQGVSVEELNSLSRQEKRLRVRRMVPEFLSYTRANKWRGAGADGETKPKQESEKAKAKRVKVAAWRAEQQDNSAAFQANAEEVTSAAEKSVIMNDPISSVRQRASSIVITTLPATAAAVINFIAPRRSPAPGNKAERAEEELSTITGAHEDTAAAAAAAKQSTYGEGGAENGANEAEEEGHETSTPEEGTEEERGEMKEGADIQTGKKGGGKIATMDGNDNAGVFVRTPSQATNSENLALYKVTDEDKIVAAKERQIRSTNAYYSRRGSDAKGHRNATYARPTMNHGHQNTDSVLAPKGTTRSVGLHEQFRSSLKSTAAAAAVAKKKKSRSANKQLVQKQAVIEAKRKKQKAEAKKAAEVAAAGGIDGSDASVSPTVVASVSTRSVQAALELHEQMQRARQEQDQEP